MNIQSESVRYQAGGTSCQGYMAWDADAEGQLPGIMIVHEWWGLNDYIRGRADMLAREGYCALAIDMYGEGKTADNPDQAGEAMNAVLGDMDTGTERLKAAHATLAGQSGVDASRIAAIGYCFGGAMVLHMARIGMPLTAVASFHGALGSFHKPSPREVNADILVCHGGDDAMVSMEDVQGFREEMDAAEATYEVVVYPGAGHGFSNPGADEKGATYNIPVGYNADADAKSWSAMLSLFDRKMGAG